MWSLTRANMRSFRSWLPFNYLQCALFGNEMKPKTSLERQESWEEGLIKEGDSKKQRIGWQKKELTDGEGRLHRDGINNGEDEFKIKESCEAWVVKAPKVKSNEDLWADSTSAERWRWRRMFYSHLLSKFNSKVLLWKSTAFSFILFLKCTPMRRLSRLSNTFWV